jgi:hypothetical protein
MTAHALEKVLYMQKLFLFRARSKQSFICKTFKVFNVLTLETITDNSSALETIAHEKKMFNLRTCMRMCADHFEGVMLL